MRYLGYVEGRCGQLEKRLFTILASRKGFFKKPQITRIFTDFYLGKSV